MYVNELSQRAGITIQFAISSTAWQVPAPYPVANTHRHTHRQTQTLSLSFSLPLSFSLSLSHSLPLTRLSHIQCMICERTGHTLTSAVWMHIMNKCMHTHTPMQINRQLHATYYTMNVLINIPHALDNMIVKQQIVGIEKCYLGFLFKHNLFFGFNMSFLCQCIIVSVCTYVCVSSVLGSCWRQIAEGFCLLQGQACPRPQASAVRWLSWRWSVSDRRDHMW